MKKLFVFGLIMGLATTGVLVGQPHRGGFEQSSEARSVSGTAVVDDWGRVSIQSAGETYHIMPAFAIPQNVEISNGDRIEVLGYEMPGPRFGTNEGDHFIRIAELTVAGRTYVLNSAHGPRSRAERGRGFDDRFSDPQAPQRGETPGGSYGRGSRR